MKQVGYRPRWMDGLLLPPARRVFSMLCGRLFSRRGRLSPFRPPGAMPRLEKDAAGRSRCVACQLCASVCPAACIEVEAVFPAGPQGEPYPGRFAIDLGRCVFCGYCVESCPQEALSAAGWPTPAAARRALVFDCEALLKD